ncbi:MAG TPA: CHAD domain-containing protein [Methylomirabilota bacterium]
MPDQSSLDHVVAAMRTQADAIRAREAGARRARDPEDVHQMRVAVRRLRAILRASRSLFAQDWVEDLRRELEWLGAALGRVRDLDVLSAYLHSQLRTRPPGGGVARRRLGRRLASDRDRAAAALRAALDGRRYARLLSRLDVALVSPPFQADSAPLADRAAAEFAKLRKAVKKLPKHPSAEELHQIRIKVKHARYAAELAQPLVGRRAERFIDKAKRLQDILGEHQDAVIADAYVRRARGGSPGARLLAKWLGARQHDRREEARADFDEQWPRLKRRGRRAWC